MFEDSHKNWRTPESVVMQAPPKCRDATGKYANKGHSVICAHFSLTARKKQCFKTPIPLLLQGGASRGHGTPPKKASFHLLPRCNRRLTTGNSWNLAHCRILSGKSLLVAKGQGRIHSDHSTIFRTVSSSSSPSRPSRPRARRTAFRTPSHTGSAKPSTPGRKGTSGKSRWSPTGEARAGARAREKRQRQVLHHVNYHVLPTWQRATPPHGGCGELVWPMRGLKLHATCGNRNPLCGYACQPNRRNHPHDFFLGGLVCLLLTSSTSERTLFAT